MPAKPQLYPYKAGPMEPIVMPGETVGIWVNKVYQFFKVMFIESLPRSNPIEQNLGALAAGAASAVTQLTILEMPSLEFGQFRCAVLDDVNIRLYQGRADQRHKLHTAVASFSRYNAIVNPEANDTEFFVFEDNWAFIDGTNETDYALDVARVVAWGYRFVLEEFPAGQYNAKSGNVPEAWTRVPATAHL